MPRKAYSVPSVTTSDGTLPNRTSTPLTSPHTAPKPSPTSSASTTGVPGAACSSEPTA